jgi:hypothetical protein
VCAAEITSTLGAAGASLTRAGSRLDPAALKALPSPVRLGFLESMATSVSTVFGWAIIFAAVVPVLAILIREVPLRGGAEPAGSRAPELAEAGRLG